ncbi:MAG: hypothetical protein ABFD04_05370 [Syntrophomonas sp.]
MRHKLFGAKGLVCCIALVAGIAVGIFNSNMVLVQAENYLNKGMMPTYVFPKNEAGQTYGSEIDANCPENAPDLIAAVGVDGTLGYVKSTDLNGPLPKTPEEAIAITKKNLADIERKIPLYAVDGKTVVGSFNIGKGQLKEK